jgi:2'-5' RNA ligase
MRLFIGLPIPAELATTITRNARTIPLPRARWTTPENIHLTLVFLGQVAEPTLPMIQHEIEELGAAPFSIKLTSLNTFPRSGVLIAEVEPTPGLLNLHSQIATRMTRCGFPREDSPDHPYHPHITLARFRGPLRLTNTQRTLPASLRRSFIADRVNLYRSNLTPHGPHYEVLVQKKFIKSNDPITQSRSIR